MPGSCPMAPLNVGRNSSTELAMDDRLTGLYTAVAAFCALGVAYFAQYVLQMTPCELCLWERWPYRIVVVLGIIAALTRPKTAKFLIRLAGLTMLADAVIAFVHVGVEQHWWKSPLPECNATLIPGAPLPLTPATPCDRPAYLVHSLPISMAQMDLVVALAFAVVLLAYAGRKKRRFK